VLKISYACCLGLSSAISTQFTLQMHAAAENCKKKHQKRLSFKVTDVDTMKKLVTSACYYKQYMCAYLQLFLR